VIVYQSTKQGFIDDVISNKIDQAIHDAFISKLGRHVGASERESWRVSMRYMRDVLNDDGVPSDSGVSIEYQIPQTAKRIDFVLTGQGDTDADHAVLIELKQWSKVNLSDKDGLVDADFYGGEVNHPSYQVWAYASLMRAFNEVVYNEEIDLHPCAYLHNYIEDDVIKNVFYSDYLEKAPVFLQGDDEKQKLRDFIKRFVKRGDKSKIMYRIDGSRIRPSKALADSLVKMLKGNQEFILIDDQKVVYETALSLARSASSGDKRVLVVNGGPGTGKSVVAMNLLVRLSQLGMNCQYVTKNAAPRAVYEKKLAGTYRRTEISNMFSGSSSFVDLDENVFDVLIIDEAHRLVGKGGQYMYFGEGQIQELIYASRVSLFFIDEDQRVTWNDVGTADEIKTTAKRLDAKVYETGLSSQFRCGGSNDYLLWVDDILQLRETAMPILEKSKFDFRIFDSPLELRKAIESKNDANKARLVAGYCWNWVSKSDKKLFDIVFPEFGFQAQWNLNKDGASWIIQPESISEIGCIHTCQGLDLEYVGVIIGPDLLVRDSKVLTVPENRATSDKSLTGYRTALKVDPEAARQKADAIIKNTYRTLMTRGMKGCYVYCTDKETAEYFKDRIKAISE